MNRAASTNSNETDPVEDQQLVKRVLSGDARAFESLLERHEQLVAHIVAGKVPSQEVAEVAHLVFVRAFQSLPNYKPVAPFAHWLTTLAVRTCYDYWRQRGRNRELPLTSLSKAQLNWLKGHSSNRDAGAELEAEDLLEWALAHLTAADRMALTLVHLEGASVAEAAEQLGWSQAKVKVRCFRARRKLRGLIEIELAKGRGNHD